MEPASDADEFNSTADKQLCCVTTEQPEVTQWPT